MAYFQEGVSNFLLGDFEEALANFNDTLLYLRGNTLIDYSQLGLLFKLYSCEVLFNRGLCYIYLQQTEAGMQDLQYAAKEKVVEDHNVIDDAIRDEAKVRPTFFFFFSFVPIPGLVRSRTDILAGLYRLFHSRWSRVQAKRGQGPEPATKRLPWKGPAGRCLGPEQRLHGLCWHREKQGGRFAFPRRPLKLSANL